MVSPQLSVGVVAALLAVILAQRPWEGGGPEYPRLSLGAGALHSCALKRDSSLWCWGHTASASTPAGTHGVPTPVTATERRRWTHVSVGGFVNCGVSSDSKVWCWGQGQPQAGPGHSPWLVDQKPIWSHVAVSQNYLSGSEFRACSLRKDSTAWCVGANSYGQRGDGTASASDALRSLAGRWALWKWASLSLGRQHTCGVRRDGRAFCWGRNHAGQLGDGTATALRLTPTPVIGDKLRWRSVSAGVSHTCAVSAERAAYCWGGNRHGELGDGSAPGKERREPAPLRVNASQLFQSIAAGAEHTCAVARDGHAWCWGRNTDGQAGQPVSWTANRQLRSPRAVALAGRAGRWREVSAGITHTCGSLTSGAVYCWGRNEHGKLGDGGRARSAAPVQVVGTWESCGGASPAWAPALTLLAVAAAVALAHKLAPPRPARAEAAPPTDGSAVPGKAAGKAGPQASQRPGKGQRPAAGQREGQPAGLSAEKGKPAAAARGNLLAALGAKAAEDLRLFREVPLMHYRDCHAYLLRQGMSDVASAIGAAVSTLLCGSFAVALLSLKCVLDAASIVGAQVADGLANRLGAAVEAALERHVGVNLREVGEHLAQVQLSMDRLAAGVADVSRLWEEASRRHAGDRAAARFERRCVDNLTAGLAACAAAFALRLWSGGMLSTAAWHAIDYCHHVPAPCWPPLGFLRPLRVLGCELGVVLSSVLAVAVAVAVPLAALLAYRIRDVLPVNLGRVIPSIRDAPVAMLSTLGAACWPGGAAAVWFFGGHWQRWSSLWILWTGLHILLLQCSEALGPAVMRCRWRRASLSAALVLGLPSLMAYLPV